ncbi:helix-turn-helix domain-containing protein [Spiroplasma citri]|nr:helix-turn-helix domain-containing protein [Spiroplasma citri]
MKDYTHLKYDERNLFKDLFYLIVVKRKMVHLILSEIARQTNRSVNTVKREIKRFKI